ncbi:response regulator [Lysobacter sp. K5869]|nr:response regulator [Lysobacter sp. K5869]
MRALAGAAALLLALCAAPASAGLPETPRPRQVSVVDGLPSNTVNRIAEDRHGYLWIATSEGLARYDGTGFRVWQREQGLRDNFVWTVHVDARNRVWVGTAQAGLAMLDPQRKRWTYFDRSNTPGLADDCVWSIASTPDGAVWFGTERGGLYRMDDAGKVQRFMPRAGDPRSLPGEGVIALNVAPDGSLWAGTRSGAARWTGRDFERVPDGALPSNLLNSISFERDGTVWFSTQRGVGARLPDGTYRTDPWAKFAPKNRVIGVMHRDRSGQYWFDLPQGLGVGGPDGIEVVPLFSAISQGLVRPNWTGAYEDREGGLWFGSNGYGLWYLPPNWRQFSVLMRRLDDPNSIANGDVRAIAPADDGDMWLVGSGGVLDKLDPETGRVEHFAKNYSDNFVSLHVLNDKRGQVWVSFYSGLVRIDPKTRATRTWRLDSAEDPVIDGSIVLVESGDLIWLIGSAGVLQARDGEGRVRETLRAGERGLPASVVVPIGGHGPDGELWLAAGHELLRWDARERRFVQVPGLAQGAMVQHFVFADRQRMWLGGFGTLDAYRWDGTRLHREFGMDMRDGLPAAEVRGLAVDANGLVWMTSKRGLVRVDPFARTARVYGVKDGLPSQEFSRAPVPRPADGRLLIGSPEGLVLFDPALVRPIRSAPELIVESIEVRRGSRKVAFPTEDADPRKALPGRVPTVTVADGDRDLRIVARLLSFNSAQSNRYRFRLSRFDPGWVDVGASGERVFSQLSPGDYRLQVMAKTADNVWTPPLTILLHVDSPWWWSWWSVAAAVALLALALAWLLMAHRNRLQRRLAWQRAEHEREVAKQASLAKSRFLATLGHEVRTPMTGVLGMSELLLDTPLDQKQRGYTESIRRAGEHLLRLVNDALDLARIESGKLELAHEPFDLRALVAQAADLMRPLAQQRGLRFEIHVADDAPRGLRGDASRVCQVLLNLLGNAIKFTDEGSVSLRVERLAPHGVRFEVSDTGPGLNEEQKQRLFRRFEQAEGARTAARYGGSGLGLAISQELAAAMEGEIAVYSEAGHGARFVFDLPLPYAEPPVGTDDRVQRLPRPHAGPLAILLVEDDATVAEVIAGLLRSQGHRVTHVGNGLAALAETATARFDIALLDLDLPGINGLELARQLRAQGFLPPLVAVTARADADAEPQAVEAGFDRFLRKPVTGAMLADALDELIANRT